MSALIAPWLSYMIRSNGERVAFMPADEEFSISELHDAVAGTPEVACFTSEGYALFHNQDAASQSLPVNEDATCLLHQVSPLDHRRIFGRVFLAHPAHIPSFWRMNFEAATRVLRLRSLLADHDAQFAS